MLCYVMFTRWQLRLLMVSTNKLDLVSSSWAVGNAQNVTGEGAVLGLPEWGGEGSEW